jgi:hypothetical protein
MKNLSCYTNILLQTNSVHFKPIFCKTNPSKLLFDVDQIASEFMKTNKSDASVKTPWRMVTRLQTRRTREHRPESPLARPDP